MNSVELPVLFVVVVAYGTICYWMTNLTNDPLHFIVFLIIILLVRARSLARRPRLACMLTQWVLPVCLQVINVGFAVAQLISAAVSSVNMAIACYMVVLVYALAQTLLCSRLHCVR